MRRPDPQKREAIRQAVFRLTRDEGLAGVSFAKIARLAQVSQATAYVYFRDKTDMLGQLYLEVKALIDEGLTDQLPAQKGLRRRFEAVLWHFARRFIAHPLEANFMRAIQANPHFVTPDTIAESMAMVDQLVALFKEAVAADVLAETDPQLVVALLFAPMTQLIETRYAAQAGVSDDELGRLITRSLDAVFTSQEE